MEEVKYSKYGLINRELLALEERGIKNRLINYVLTDKKLAFSIQVPNDLYARAESLCDDIVQMREGNKDYTQVELVQHVFLDFLDEVRKNYGDVHSIYTRLDIRRQELPMVNDRPLVPSRSMKTLQIKIHREDVLRAEWFLSDLSYFVPGHGLQVEKLIEIVYLDFLLEYKKGRRKNVIMEILQYIS